MSRLTELLKKAAWRPKARHATKPTRSSQRKRVDAKTQGRDQIHPRQARAGVTCHKPEDKRMQYSFCECAKGPCSSPSMGPGCATWNSCKGSPVLPQAEWQRDDAALAPLSSSLPPALPAACGAISPGRHGHTIPAGRVAGVVRHPYGETVSYLQIAEAIGNPRAGAGGGRRQRPQSPQHHSALPRGHRAQR